MNFIIDLLLLSGHNAICVIVNRLIKERHYITCTASDNDILINIVIDIIISWVFRLHELSTSIVSNRES